MTELPFHVYWYIPSAEMSEVITVAVVVLSRFPRISTHTSTLPFSSGTKICASTNPISAAMWQTRCTMVTKRVNWAAHNLKLTTSWRVFTASKKKTITGLLQKTWPIEIAFYECPSSCPDRLHPNLPTSAFSNTPALHTDILLHAPLCVVLKF